jgi:hypothetical protein
MILKVKWMEWISNMSKQLLIETRHFDPKPMKLVEGMSKNGNVFVEGIIATVEVKNGNGRYYKRELWEREIDNFTRKIQMKSTETVGELDHPDSQVINLKNASHAIREIWWRGDEIYGRIEIFSDMGDLGTTSGRIAGALVKNGLIIGISSRGMGSLKQMGEVMEVQDDFELLTWDLVSNPSNPDSWMKNGALNESRTTYLDQYARTNTLITEILCAKGTCPIF